MPPTGGGVYVHAATLSSVFLKSVHCSFCLSPVVRIELSVRPVPLVRLGELQARAAATAVAHVVEGVVHGGGDGEGEAAGTRVWALANHAAEMQVRPGLLSSGRSELD